VVLVNLFGLNSHSCNKPGVLETCIESYSEEEEFNTFSLLHGELQRIKLSLILGTGAGNLYK